MVAELCRNPILILEGLGDVGAVPLLIRRVMEENDIYDLRIAPRPKTNVEIARLRQPGQIERYLDFCNRDVGDSILIALDCDDGCPVETARDFGERIRATRFQKPVSVCLFHREYESIFLPSIELIAAKYPDFRWRKLAARENIETIRDVKGEISRMMGPGRAYKPTSDQARFTAAIDLHRTRHASRSFRHFENSILWLTRQEQLSGAVHPM